MGWFYFPMDFSPFHDMFLPHLPHYMYDKIKVYSRDPSGLIPRKNEKETSELDSRKIIFNDYAQFQPRVNP
jgi:hypothetical protein